MIVCRLLHAREGRPWSHAKDQQIGTHTYTLSFCGSPFSLGDWGRLFTDFSSRGGYKPPLQVRPQERRIVE